MAWSSPCCRRRCDWGTDGMQATNALGVTITDRTCLIMDEVDGMSAGDRGGVGALSTLIKKTKVRDLSVV